MQRCSSSCAAAWFLVAGVASACGDDTPVAGDSSTSGATGAAEPAETTSLDSTTSSSVAGSSGPGAQSSSSSDSEGTGTTGEPAEPLPLEAEFLWIEREGPAQRLVHLQLENEALVETLLVEFEPGETIRGFLPSPEGLRAAIYLQRGDLLDLLVVDMSEEGPAMVVQANPDPIEDLEQMRIVWIGDGDQLLFQSGDGIWLADPTGAAASTLVAEKPTSTPEMPTDFGLDPQTGAVAIQTGNTIAVANHGSERLITGTPCMTLDEDVVDLEFGFHPSRSALWVRAEHEPSDETLFVVSLDDDGCSDPVVVYEHLNVRREVFTKSGVLFLWRQDSLPNTLQWVDVDDDGASEPEFILLPQALEPRIGVHPWIRQRDVLFVEASDSENGARGVLLDFEDGRPVATRVIQGPPGLDLNLLGSSRWLRGDAGGQTYRVDIDQDAPFAEFTAADGFIPIHGADDERACGIRVLEDFSEGVFLDESSPSTDPVTVGTVPSSMTCFFPPESRAVVFGLYTEAANGIRIYDPEDFERGPVVDFDLGAGGGFESFPVVDLGNR